MVGIQHQLGPLLRLFHGLKNLERALDVAVNLAKVWCHDFGALNVGPHHKRGGDGCQAGWFGRVHEARVALNGLWRKHGAPNKGGNAGPWRGVVEGFEVVALCDGEAVKQLFVERAGGRIVQKIPLHDNLDQTMG